MTETNSAQRQRRAGFVRARVWMAHHAGEVAAVAAPSAVALTVSPWAWLATVATGGLWARHELRTRRRTSGLRVQPAGDPAELPDSTDCDVDSDGPAAQQTEVSTHG